MKTFAIRLSAAAVLFPVMLGVLPAQAQKWVASNGSNANPCTRTNPCITFVAAYNAAAAGDEIRCVDSGFFGGLVISKSITINCEDNIGTADLIFVSVAATDVVVLKGLDIYGLRANHPGGTFGLNLQTTGLVKLENVNISGWQGGGGGIRFNPTGPAKLVMSNSTVADNGTGGNILIRPTTGVDGTGVAALFDRVTVAGSVFGIKADGSGQAAG